MTRRSILPAAVLAVACFSAAMLAMAPAHAQACAQLEVQNVRAGQGTLMVAAYTDAASFNKTPAAAIKMPASSAVLRFPLCGLSGDTVSVTLYQDLNDNGKLDTNPFGMPTEPWGASGKPAAMSAPVWASTAVPLDGTAIVIALSK